MPLFLRKGCFPVDFQEVKRPLRTKSVKRPIKVGKRPINEGKRPIKAKVLVGVSVGCSMGCFRAPPPWRKTAPLKRPIKFSGPFCLETPHFYVRCPQIVRNCSRELSLEHCHCRAFFVPKFWGLFRTFRFTFCSVGVPQMGCNKWVFEGCLAGPPPF